MKPAAKRLCLSRKHSIATHFGFSSAAALLEESTDRINGISNDDAKPPSKEVLHQSPMKHGSSRATVVIDSPSNGADREESNKHAIASEQDANDTQQEQEAKDFQIVLTMVGWKYYEGNHDIPSTGTSVELQREPDNEYDSNAIAIVNTHSSRTKMGYVIKDDAALLASCLDSGSMKTTSVSIHKCFQTSFQILVEGIASGSTCGKVVNHFAARSNVDATDVTSKIAKRDVECSQCAPYSLQDLSLLPWNPLPDWKVSIEMPTLPWGAPFDASKFHSPPLATHEIQATMSVSWPPSDDILLRLGMAQANHETWWKSVAGLLPPNQWNVSGALDTIPRIRTTARSQKELASSILDGAMHGVSEVWHPDTLEAIGQLMQEPHFWCRRSCDALIRSFGGPYVLGQEEEKLKLIRGAPHTELTQKMSVAHNLVYTAVHLVHPASPGFNTLIFGCNLRGAGFHFHQDSVPSLKAKNAPLIPKQPVVTTVFYEKPDSDSGKEIVNWKPILNFSPVVPSQSGNNTGGSEYLGARIIPTLHGMVHVQRAGLQKTAVHGVFHAPNTPKRTGFRIAITARITKPNAEEDLQEYMHQYKAILGPGGDLQLSKQK